jgi:MFS transporter, NNP family, nitrate/nitrite transporter
VMGIAGAGNSGTLLATLFAPRLAQSLGWHNVFAIAALPVMAVWVIFFLLAKDAPGARHVKTWSDYASVLKIPDTAWFCFLYSLTFGGFSGLVSYLSIFFHDQYHLTKVQSGDVTTFVVIFGSFLRPVGGALSDRLGGYRMLLLLLTASCLLLASLALLPPVAVAIGLLSFTMSMLGMGNGSVFQLVPQRFPDRVGILTGLVGAAGGFGGFLLPSLLGLMKDLSGSFSTGFMILSGAFLAGSLALLYLKNVWTRTWPADAALRAGLTPTLAEKSAAYAAGS